MSCARDDCHRSGKSQVEDFNSVTQPYLHADPIALESLRNTLEQASGGKPIIGVSWMSKNKRFGKRRSISLIDLVAAIPEDYYLINLQYGEVMAI